MPVFRSWRLRNVIATSWYCAVAAGRLSIEEFVARRHEDMFYFVTGLVCQYSPLHLKLRTLITLPRIQDLQQHFQCHNQYYSRLTVSVCKHTATLCTVTSVLLLGVVQCSGQHCVPGVPHHIPYRTGIRGTYQNCGTNVKIRKKEIRFLPWVRKIFTGNSDPVN